MYDKQSHHHLALFQHQKTIKMGAAKLVALLMGSINLMLYVFAFISNLDNVKSTILFIVALGMSMYRFYRWAINSEQNKRLKDLAIEERANQVRKQDTEIREIELDQEERRLSLQMTSRMLNNKE